MTTTNEKECFVIGPVGDPGSPIRKRADQILEYLIEPAAKERGYKPLRADQINESGMITVAEAPHNPRGPICGVLHSGAYSNKNREECFSSKRRAGLFIERLLPLTNPKVGDWTQSKQNTDK